VRSFGLILRDAEVDALQNGTFEVHCLTMRLERGTGDDAVAYAGPGSIRRTPDGRTHVRLYAQDQYDLDPARQSLRGHRFVPESAYFRLTATDRAGRRWRCDHVLLPGWVLPGAGGSVIEARLRRLTVQQDLADTPLTAHIADKLAAVDRIELAVFDELPFPETDSIRTTARGGGFASEGFVRAVAELRACDRQVTIIRHGGRTVLRAFAEPGPFPQDFAHHLVDALQFVLARRIEVPLVSVRVDGVETVTILDGRRERSRGGNLHPPLPGNMAHAEQHVWPLFDRYVRHVTAAPAEAPHRLAALWAGVLRASAGSLEVAARVYAVAVESVLNLVPSTRERRTTADHALAECRARLLDVLATDPAPTAVKERLTNLLGSTSLPRPHDHLHALARAGAVTPGLIPIWKRVRKHTAHGEVPVDVNEAPEELLLLVEQVATLLYELVYHLVGYEGLYTTYADGRGRVRPYPLPPPDANAP
jgi:hypothetical protein